MIGKTLSHYKLLEKLGAGGMGEVYLAEDTTLKRQVALKVLPPDLAGSQERLDRFQREAEALAALDHPNIVTIHTVEEAEGVRFLTMQRVEGERLSEKIPKGGMSLRRVFEVAIPLADALAAAHDKGVIHRDLKPGNIMVTREGRVKVLDFGLAKLRLESDRIEASELPTEPLTEEGRILGTIPYMSPEQLEGKDLDSRSDIFSLGVILYEMATGKRPFRGNTSVSLITAIIRDTPQEVDAQRDDLPHHLSRVVSRCLAKDPARRYQSALDVRNELEDLEREVASGVVSSSSGEAATAPRPPRRYVRWIVGAALAALLAIGSVVLLSRNDRAKIVGGEIVDSAQAKAQPTESQEALRHYLRGRYLFARWTEEGLQKSIEQFEQAVAIDPNFALAYTGLAEAYMFQGDVLSVPGDLRPVDFMPRARELVLKAIEIDNDLSDAHRMLGYIRWVYDFQYEDAQHEAKLATEMDPTNPLAWDNYGLALSVMGRDEEAISAFRRAIELDPVAPGILSDFGVALTVAGEYQQALEATSTAIELNPNLSVPYLNAGQIAFLLGDRDAALSWLEQASAMSGHPLYRGVLGYVQARVGSRDKALSILDELMEMRERRYVSPRAIAWVHLGLGDFDAAIEWFIRAAETRDPWVNYWDIRNPLFDELRDHPRYSELLRPVKLEG